MTTMITAPSTAVRKTRRTLAPGKMPRFDYRTVAINDLKVNTETDEKGRRFVANVEVEGEPISDSSRFWTSLYAKYGINGTIFKYFDHAETFQRIASVEKSDRVRVCVERGEDEEGKPMATLMGATAPQKPIVVFDDLIELLNQYGGVDITYTNGLVESHHVPRVGQNQFDIAGDVHANRFLMSTPIDGYGLPNIYLALLRMVCMNGAIGYTAAFKSGLALGKGNDDVAPALIRALDGFNNDEGFAALRQRVEAATKSWASVNETQQLYKLLARMHADKMLNPMDSALSQGTSLSAWMRQPLEGTPMGEKDEHIGSPLFNAFHRMTGDFSRLYGIANPDSLSAKRQRALPVKCTVYDAINYATEVATHYATPSGARLMNAWVGGTLGEEYDMEGTRDKFTEFADFHIERKLATGVTGSAFESN